MHDPLVVAFTIRRPWPRWFLAGRGWYWPSLITIWHVEPGGHDSGEVCPHFARVFQLDGTWSSRPLNGWRWHVDHWRIQIHPLQQLRRRLLTRCTWCGGRQGKRDAVNVSNGGHRERGPWWRGERGLFHMDCASVARAHRMCLCADPICDDSDSSGQPFGYCARCGRHRSFRATPAFLDRMRLLTSIPAGRRNPALYTRVCDMAQADRQANHG